MSRFMSKNKDAKKNSENSSSYSLYFYGFITGVTAHTIGYAVELVSNYSFRKYLPNMQYGIPVLTSKMLHEGIENIISTGGFINLLSLNNFKDSIFKSFEPLYEEPGKFTFAAAFSYISEVTINNFLHCSHNHDHTHDGCKHDSSGIILASIFSIVGASIGIAVYEKILTLVGVSTEVADEV